ncbi:type VI secretion system baseplate subunit TssG [Pseudoduganella sp. SL102]|uniref:type VI secretion system baseplate subunit TssG n=1 Tax=Pseudoduganella sp. SL102 TaxID=2995154 RepID=UPI00248CF61B|nr:type VI secretion system baseplate subunit TssG [Pseudoduganella sp. SL102]WBS04806.1 type VI secretion system baseplate subunit TssG [Pseudoduganella sp. SL102]
MQPAQRRFEPAVIERLFAQPHRFEYFQAVRMFELWLKRHGRVREGAVANFLRFSNSTSLAFPASELEAIQAEPREAGLKLGLDRHSLGAALRDATLRYVRITPAFMGLLGGMGALPAHYTERIASHMITTRDDGPRAFLDTFSNRALALFYEAWRKYRLELKYQIDGKDGFLPLLLSLAGVGQPSLRRRFADGEHGELLDESVAYFATAMRHRPASSVQIARVLSEYFGVPVKTEQFIGRWYDMPAAQQSRLGFGNAVLGASAMAGARVWQRDLRLRLLIGPLKRARFEAFLPGGKAARALASMLSMMTGVSLEYEVQLVLCAKEVEGATLSETRSGGRLGWDTFLVTGDKSRDRDDVRYDVHAL